jgi:hypothetical protein
MFDYLITSSISAGPSEVSLSFNNESKASSSSFYTGVSFKIDETSVLALIGVRIPCFISLRKLRENEVIFLYAGLLKVTD